MDYIPQYMHQALPIVSRHQHYASNAALINDRIIELDMVRYSKRGDIGDAPFIFIHYCDDNIHNVSVIHSIFKEKGITPISNIFGLACKYRYKRVIRYCINRGIDDVNIKPVSMYIDDNSKQLYTKFHDLAYIYIYKHQPLDIVQYTVYNTDYSNVSYRNYTMPLMLACKNNKIDVVKYLHSLDTPNVMTQRDAHGVTSLMLACKGNTIDIVQHLVESGANVNDHDDDDMTPLMYACKCNTIDIVKYLVEHGACLTDRDEYNDGILQYACCNPNGYAILEYLMQYDLGSDDGENIIKLACQFQHSQLLDILLLFNRHNKINKDNINKYNKLGCTPLMYACIYNRPIQVIRLLVENGADVNSHSVKYNCLYKSPLIRACEYDINEDKHCDQSTDERYKNLFEIIQYLVKNGADVGHCELNFHSALTYACELYYPMYIIDYLTDRDCNIQNRDCTYIMDICCRCNRLDLVEYFVNRGVNINAICQVSGHTALSYACYYNLGFNYVKRLIDSNADPNIPLKSGYTPLLYECIGRVNNGDTIRYLISYGANVNVDVAGVTPLMYMCARKDLETIKCMIDHGANINAVDEQNMTPLMYAEKYNASQEIIEYLESKGATSNLMTLPTFRYQQHTAGTSGCIIA